MVVRNITRSLATTGLAGVIALATALSASPVAPSTDEFTPDLLGEDATPEELAIANAPVAPDQVLQFGAVPLGYAQDAAATAAGSASCAITAAEATALLIAMTWPEVSPGGAPPSPMTLSRWDTQSSLADPHGRAPGLWFHPGIGMWQLDSAGLGTDFTAAEAMDTQNAASRMAPYIVNRYCTSRNSGASPAQARAHAWQAWVACRQGACEDTYHRALAGVTAVDGVDRHGGALPRRCWFQGGAHDCTFVDVANAQGATWWTQPGGGPSPVAAPFYVIKLGGSPAVELRYWLAQDSGASTDVQATRPFGANARGGLTWATGPGLCDLTAWRGDC
jgi:hypothetical protein